jgi:hypothetical protein
MHKAKLMQYYEANTKIIKLFEDCKNKIYLIYLN